MKDETKFWKRLAIALGLILIVIVGTSSYYYTADLADVCTELSNIASELSSIKSAIDDIYWQL